jgi:hypothetical protein
MNMKMKISSKRRSSTISGAVRVIARLEDIPNIGPAIAAVRFMAGEAKKPWWKYTAERKRELAARSNGGS